ncbi:hypothetical protein L6164_009503 [Bauhinia variegata]|nr:hypothetical protein L6164_009503 [Bauhinia variegata]
MRIWEIYRKEGNVYNKGYIAMITAMIKFDDIESAEKIFEEWESKKLSYDIRIPNYLIGAYCRKGLVEAAEALVNWVKFSGGEPDARTRYYLANGCLQRRDYVNAVDYMREVISIREPWWMPRMETLAACLEFLKGEGDIEEAEDFIRSLRNKDLVSSNIHDRLLEWIRDRESSLRAINMLGGDATKEEASNIELPKSEQDCSSSSGSNESSLLRCIKNLSKRFIA